MSWKDVFKGVLVKKIPKKKNESTEVRTGKHISQSKRVLYSGVETQFHGVTPENQHKQLVCGLDFGTAFTKVVVGEERIRYAVPWSDRKGAIDEYLLPGAFWVDQQGECALTDNQGSQVKELKMRLLNGDRSEKIKVEVCVFLALVLRRVRAYILNEQRTNYQSNYIDWLINIGLPTDNYHSESLVELYRQLVLVAWRVSAQDGPVTLKKVSQMLRVKHVNGVMNNGELDSEAISPFPEFVAQVTGYVRSPLRQPDMHLLVDIGAGTVDATVFNVHEKEGEDRFPIFAKAVKPLGTRYLVRHRINGKSATETGELDTFATVPNKARFAKLLQESAGSLDQLDRSFRDQVLSQVVKILRYTKAKRYPRSRCWEKGVPMFLCGGGAKCDFYQETLSVAGSLGPYPVINKGLPKPDNLEAPGIDGNDYDRLAVAYGLSFDPFDIGEIIKMDEVEDIVDRKPVVSGQGGTVANVVCKKCGGTGGLHMPCKCCGGSGFAT